MACGWVRTLSFSQAAGGLLRVLGGGPPLAGLVGAAERHQAPWLPRPASSGTALTGHTHWRRPPASSPRPAPAYEAAVASFRVKGHGHCDRVVARLRDRPRRPTREGLSPGEALAPRREPGGALSLDPIRTDCRWAGFQLPLFGEAEPPPGQDNLIKLIGEAEDGPPGTRAEGASDRIPLDSRGGWAIRLSQATVPGAKDQRLGLRPDRGSGPCGSPHPLVGCCSSCPQTRRACLPGCHPTSSRGLRPDDLGTVGRMAA